MKATQYLLRNKVHEIQEVVMAHPAQTYLLRGNKTILRYSPLAFGVFTLFATWYGRRSIMRAAEGK